MANRDNTMGFRLALNIGQRHVFKLFSVDAANSTNVFVGDVMDMVSQGGVRPALADAGVSAAGICVALYDANGFTCGLHNSSVATKYLPALTAGYCLVSLGLPGSIFIAQAQTGTTPTSADIGATTDHVAGVGNTATARSKHELNFSDLGTGLQFRIVGLVHEPTNTFEEHADLYVTFNESAYPIIGGEDLPG